MRTYINMGKRKYENSEEMPIPHTTICTEFPLCYYRCSAGKDSEKQVPFPT